jgi:hypothetical protein
VGRLNIPQELVSRKNWVCYRLVPDPEKPEKKPAKVPHQVSGPLAKSNDPSTWSTFEQARAAVAAGKFDGVSYALSAEDGLVCVDLDNARNPETGHPEPWAAPIIHALRSYTEVSPSGTGYHVFVRGVIPKASHKQGSTVELYAGVKIMATTGTLGFQGYDKIESCPEVLADLFTRAEAGEFAPAQRSDTPAQQLPSDNQSDADFALACKLAREYAGDAVKVRAAFLAQAAPRPKLNRPDYVNRTIEKAIAQVLTNRPLAETVPVVERPEITIEEEPLPNFPRFTGSLAELSEALFPDLPYCHKFMTALTLVGGALSGKVRLADTPYLDPRFYVILIDVGGAGKGGTWVQVHSVLAPLLGDLRIKNSVDSGPALVQHLAFFPRTLLFSDELSALFEKAKITGGSRNTLFSELLTLHDNNETENDAKSNLNLTTKIRNEICEGSSIKVSNAHLCMLGHVQPLIFQTMWGGTKGGSSGLQSRFVLASSGQLTVPEPQAPSDTDKVEAAVARIKRQIEKYAGSNSSEDDSEQIVCNPAMIRRSQEIGQRQRDWWKENMGRPGASSRLPAILSRFGMLLAITNDCAEITPELFEQVLAFGEYQIALGERFMPSDSVSFVHTFEKLIVRMFEKHGKNGLTFTECRRYVNPEKKTLLGGYGPFWTAWNNLLRCDRLRVCAKNQRSAIYELHN